jgi:hypothetical protein
LDWNHYLIRSCSKKADLAVAIRMQPTARTIADWGIAGDKPNREVTLGTVTYPSQRILEHGELGRSLRVER